MNTDALGFIFISSLLINNFVLSYFLGICPFLGVSGRLSTAIKMGIAVTFVMVISSLSASGIHHLLVWADALFLQLISYILVIASAVQLVEMIIKKYSRPLFEALGIFLPLITTNCAILGVALFQTAREYNVIQSVVFALGAGAGFTLALAMMAGLREQLNFAKLPRLIEGTALTLFVAGILSMAFMGFAGLGG